MTDAPQEVHARPISATAASALARNYAIVEARKETRSRRYPLLKLSRRVLSTAGLLPYAVAAAGGLIVGWLIFRLIPGARRDGERFPHFLRRQIGIQRLLLIEVPRRERGWLWRRRDRLVSLCQTVEIRSFASSKPRRLSKLHDAYAEIFGPVYPFLASVAVSDYEAVHDALHKSSRQVRMRRHPTTGEVESLTFAGTEPSVLLDSLFIPHIMDGEDPRRPVVLDIQAIISGPLREYPKVPPELVRPYFDAGDLDTFHETYLGAFLAALWYKWFEIALDEAEIRRLHKAVLTLGLAILVPEWLHRRLGDEWLFDSLLDDIDFAKSLFLTKSRPECLEKLKTFCTEQAPGCAISMDIGLQCAAIEFLIAGGSAGAERMVGRLEAEGGAEVERYRRAPRGWVYEVLRHDTPIVRVVSHYTDRPMEFTSLGRRWSLPVGTALSSSLCRAHQDARFEHAQVFDAERDQSPALVFNAQESFYRHPEHLNEVAPRACPGRDIALSLLAEAAELVVGSYEAAHLMRPLDGGLPLRLVDGNDGYLACREMGEGPLVLLTHGFPDHADAWVDALPVLAEAGFRGVAYALRGFPPSSVRGRITRPEDNVADLLGLMDALGAERASIVATGHWGSVLAYGAATVAPDRIERIVTVGMPHPAVFEGRPEAPWRSAPERWLRARIGSWLLRRRDFRVLDRLYQAASPTWRVPAAHRARVRRVLTERAGLSGILSQFRGHDGRYSPLFGQAPVQRPTLALATQHPYPLDVWSVATPRFRSEYRIERLETGQYAHLERPQEVYAHIVSFLSEGRA